LTLTRDSTLSRGNNSVTCGPDTSQKNKK